MNEEVKEGASRSRDERTIPVHIPGTVPTMAFRLGWVYVVGGVDGPVKIGWTLNPADRIKSIQNACPNEVTVLGAFRGHMADEQRLHERFGHLRIRQNGEWFNRDELLGRFILCLSEKQDVRMDFEFDWALSRERWQP